MKVNRLFEVARDMAIPVAHKFAEAGEEQGKIAELVDNLCKLIGSSGLVCGILNHSSQLLATLGKNMIDQDFSYDEFKSQALFLQRSLSNPDKVRKDFDDHIAHNYDKGNVSFEDYKERVDTFFNEYSKMHKSLPSYNMLQRWCKELGEQVGKRDFDAAKVTIDIICQHTSSPEKFHEVASSHHVKNDGQLAEV